MLQCVREISDMRLVCITGGTAHNAIPRDAEAAIYVPAVSADEVKSLVSCCEAVIKNEFRVTDPNMKITVTEINETPDRRAMLSYVSLEVVDFLRAIPHGVAAYSTIIEGLVETSSNLAIVCVKDGKLHVKVSSRSSEISRRDAIVSGESVGRLVGANIKAERYVPSSLILTQN